MSGGKVSATKIYIDSKHNIFLHFLRPRPPPVALTYGQEWLQKVKDGCFDEDVCYDNQEWKKNIKEDRLSWEDDDV